MREPEDARARSVFDGLAPTVTYASDTLQDRARSAAMHTVPLILVGSLAAMTLTGPVEPAIASSSAKPKGVAGDLGRSLRGAVHTAIRSTAAVLTGTAVPAPTTYRVVEGDTVSDIAGRFGLSTASVLALNGLDWSTLIFPGQELRLTVSGPVAPPTPTPGVAPGARYTIVAGDTISAIADRHGISTLSLLTANGLGWSSIIYPGQTVAIPGLLGAESVEASPVDADEPAPPPAPVETPAPVVEAPVAPVITWTVARGDTVSAIAARHGVTTQAVLDANGLVATSLIFPGTVLVIPGASAPATVETAEVTGLDGEMAANAATIIQVGRELGVPDAGIIIALATAMQESSLRNLDWGDRDSVGLFQQRPSAGWGTIEDLTTPAHAARLFYGGPANPNAGSTRGLLDIAGWESMTLAQAAQAVQISAFPDAYAKWESSAREWFSALG